MNISLEKYWITLLPTEDSHFLKIKEVLLAVIYKKENVYCISTTNTYWQTLYQNKYNTYEPYFDTLEKAKLEAETTFIEWMQLLQEEFNLN